MKFLSKIIIILLLSFTLQTHAEGIDQTYCWFSDFTDKSSSDSGWFPNYQDCYTITVTTKIITGTSPDRGEIYFTNVFYQMVNPYVLDYQGSTVYTVMDTQNTLYVGDNAGLPDGKYYWVVYALNTVGEIPDPIPFWIKDGLFYDNENDIPKATKENGDIEFGLAIIITLLCLGYVGFIYNRTSKKKAWN